MSNRERLELADRVAARINANRGNSATEKNLEELEAKLKEAK